MATATEISTRALRRIGAIDALQSPSSADIQTATEALNAMIASWEADGLSGDVLPLDSRFEQGVVAMLAVRICEEYGKSPGAVLLRDAKQGQAQIDAAFIATPNATYDTALLTGTYRYQPNDETAAKDWLANTAYTLRAFVSNGANEYELVTAGTSAPSGGPTGTGSEITDGTCVWCWRRVLAQ